MNTIAGTTLSFRKNGIGEEEPKDIESNFENLLSENTVVPKTQPKTEA